MKKFLVVILMSGILLGTCCPQDIPPAEQQLENLANTEEPLTEDDSYILQLEQFRKNPLDLNKADATELKELGIPGDLQIAHLMIYRKLLGPFLSVYELQAVPTWDIAMIRKILPFITVNTAIGLSKELGKRFRNGEHSLLLRASQVMERSAGFARPATGMGYEGSRWHLFLRYRYSYKNLLQYGWVGDKDAGEQFFNGAQRTGFDFYSFHLFARNTGIIQSLAIGDFTVNMGQGLIHWQSLAFKKSAETMSIKRQSPVLRPYNSGGEFYFHRGAGVSIRKGKIETTLFVSLRKLGANTGIDTAGQRFVSSILNSGYHRTAGESAHRNSVSQTVFGSSIIYRGNQWQIGLNGVHYDFSLSLQKRDEPYNLYAIDGQHWYNLSIDYSYSYRNIHFFGEAAADKNFNKAMVNGLVMSVDPRMDISVVQRTIEAAYQSVYGNAFTENTYPANEKGVYTGASIRPVAGVRIDAYVDVFTFPWLRYQADAPGNGMDLLVQFNYAPNKQATAYSRFRSETKPLNQGADTVVTRYPVSRRRISWQTQVNYQLNKWMMARSRVDIVWFNAGDINKETGFLSYLDLVYKRLGKKYNGVLRIQYFETGGYNSRIYAYENDVLYSNSIPAFYQKGTRYYVNFNYDIDKKTSAWLRWSQILYRDQQEIGSGLDAIPGNKKTEIKFQIMRIF